MTIKTIGRCLSQAHDGSLWFFCKGCDLPHSLKVGSGPGPRWGYNENPETPTFTPSVLVRWNEWEEAKVCHSFATDGRIPHALAGQTVDLPDWEASWNSW